MKADWLLLSLICISASAQVKVIVPQSGYRSHELIDVQVVNSGKGDVSFCIENGYWSFPSKGPLETTPNPVYVQSKGPKGWVTLLTGPDIGSMRDVVILGRDASEHYPFRISQTGQMRLVHDYWPGKNEDACKSAKGHKTAKSKTFAVE